MTVKLFVVSPQLTPHGSRHPLGESLGELIPLLGERDVQVEAVLPLMSDVEPNRHGLARRLTKIEVDVAGKATECALYEGRWGPHQARLWFVDHPESFQRESPHAPHDDDPLRYYLLAASALQLARQNSSAPDVLLAMGWQSALAPMLARREPFFERTKVVFAVEDPRDRGLFDAAMLDQLRLGYDHFTPEGIEFHGQVSLLKTGVVFADRVVLPSTSAVEDLQQEAYGAGLHGLYGAHGGKLVGILGGMNSNHWDPSKDHRLAACFTPEALEGKEACKAALQQELGLQRRPNAPLVAIFGPFDANASLAHLAAMQKEWPQRKLQFAFLGTADAEQKKMIEGLAAACPERVAHAAAPPSEDQLHRVLAGADALLIPSGYAAAGLDLLKALRYGAVLVGHASGAARDVMVDFDVISRTGNAFVAEDTPLALLAAVDRFLASFESKERWRTLQRNAMGEHFLWQTTAERWRAVLSSLVGA